MPPRVLRQVWQNTTQPFVTFDVPIYEEFFTAIRAANMSAPPSRQLRVLLGDPPVDWSRVTSTNRSEWQAGMRQRDSFPAGLVRQEVGKGRRVLLIYGDTHLERHRIDFDYASPAPPDRGTIVQDLEAGAPSISVFSITTNTATDLTTLAPEIRTWATPSFVATRGSVLGSTDYAFYNVNSSERFAPRDGSFVPVPRDQWKLLRMEEQFDAILYLGSPSDITFSELTPELCRDPDYVSMRVNRFGIVGMPPAVAERFKSDCAAAGSK